MNTRKLKVLHVVSGELNNGAARGAVWLHEEMLAQGIDSVLFHTGSRDWNSKEKSIFSSAGNIRAFLVKLILRIWRIYTHIRYPKYTGDIFSSGNGYISLTKLELQYNPDVIHLHWINLYSIRYSSIKKVKAKVVWTLRDMWSFTGGCHYAVGCNRFHNGCGRCPILGSNSQNDLSSYLYKRKEQFFPKNVHFIGISEWVLREFGKSRLSSSNTTFIPNAIFTSAWQRADSQQRILEFAAGRKIILVGAVNLSLRYKGAEFIHEVSNRLDPQKYCIIVFGKSKQDFLDKLGLDTFNLGVIRSNEELCAIYSSCDAYLFPSRLEAFGKTVLESILCGTPVVCFDSSGPAEIVKHNRTGYICKSFETDSLIKGIVATTSMKIDEDIRYETAKYYSVKRIVQETKKLYLSI